MKKRNFFLLFILCVAQICTFNLHAMDGGGAPPQDPLVRMNYRDAFDQERIHTRFCTFLGEQGCAENVFGSMGCYAKEAEHAISVPFDEHEEEEGLLAADGTMQRYV